MCWPKNAHQSGLIILVLLLHSPGPSGGEFVAPSAPEISTTLTFGSGTVVPFIGLMFDITDDLVAVESPENFTITLSTSDPRVLIGGSHIILDGVDIEVFTVFRELSVIITDNEGMKMNMVSYPDIHVVLHVRVWSHTQISMSSMPEYGLIPRYPCPPL